MLYIFDLDDTLIAGYVRRQPYDIVTPLPRRVEKLKALRAAGHTIAIATNQGGVAFGSQSEQDVTRKLFEVIEKLGLPNDITVAVCYAHPSAKLEAYRDPVEVARRKPSGAMIAEICAAHPEAAKGGVLCVGDRPEDEAAAQNAGVAFMWTVDFFEDDVSHEGLVI